MQRYKGEDIVQSSMGGFKTPDDKFVYGSLVLTPSAMVYYDKKVEDVCPLVNAEKAELVKGGPVFSITLKAGGEKQYRTGNAKAWVTKLEEWIERAGKEPPAAAAPPSPVAQGASPPVQPAPLQGPALPPPQQAVPSPPVAAAEGTAAQPAQHAQPAQPQPVVEVILAGLEPRTPSGNEFRLPVHEWAQVWAVVSAMIVMAPPNESISKDVAIQVLLPSTGFQVAGLDHRVAAQIIDTALVQQQQKTIDLVSVTYSKIDFGIIYEDMKGVPSPLFDPDKFLENCTKFLEFAKDNLGFTVTVAKPALIERPTLAEHMQFCTQCGKKSGGDARFCVRCGKPLKPA